MDPPVDAVDDKADAVAELIGEPLVDDAADDRRPDFLTMQIEAFESTLLAALGQRSVDRLHDVAALAKLPHRRFEPLGEHPHARLGFLSQAIALQRLQASDPQRSVEFRADLTSLRPQVQHELLGLRHHGAIPSWDAIGHRRAVAPRASRQASAGHPWLWPPQP